MGVENPEEESLGSSPRLLFLGKTPKTKAKLTTKSPLFQRGKDGGE
jgi:hypothetical protein